MSAEREPAASNKNSRWSLRVSFWLVALAIVPLLGATWFGLTEVSRVNEARARAEDVAEATQELAMVTELRARLLDERNWVAAEVALDALGIDPSIVTVFISTDIPSLRADAVVAVDEYVAALEWHDAAEELEALRSLEAAELTQISTAYDVLTRQIGERAANGFDRLFEISGDMPDGGELANALRVFDAASQARQAVTTQLSAFFGVQFVPAVTNTSTVRELVVQRADYQSGIAEVSERAAPGSHARAALDAIEANAQVQEFRRAVDDLLLDTVIMEGISTDLLSLVSRLDEMSERFTAATESVDLHVALLEAARFDMVKVGDQYEQDAADATRLALVRIGVLGVASLLFALGLARAIGRPLADLAIGARELRDGKTIKAVDANGPREVREAILALNEASGHIELAQRQARALAAGELNNPALSESAPGALGESLQEAVQTLASSLNERESLELQLTHEATHDSLTHLANRSASLQHLEGGLASIRDTDRLLVLSFIDLDGFKLVNDLHGHHAGDRVLGIIAERLGAATNPGDLVGRLGGDEFVVITTHHRSEDDVLRQAEQIIESVGRPIALETTTVNVSASMGIAIADGDALISANELLTNADLAVYKAKERGRATIEVCDEELRRELEHRNAVERALREALAQRDFELHFQPIIDASHQRIELVEALIRWECAELGVRSPADFIPIAERSELIHDVDRAVVREVARQLHEWANVPGLGEMRVSVNISASHLRSRTFVNDTLAPLADYGVDPARLVIEVTESALLDDIDDAAGKLSSLREAGIDVAIDDFGTGYTSLGQLRRLPVDLLKIDRSFVIDTGAHALVKLIISMGHVLGANVIAEGIETDVQAGHMIALGADQLQGFLFGRPVSAAALEALVADRGSVAPPAAGLNTAREPVQA